MRVTGTTFLIGSLAISGLPPFNGFVSEFLVYLGGFKGVALDSRFAMSLLAIISLAIIGGLALACFTKVVGVVFQGEPRSCRPGMPTKRVHPCWCPCYWRQPASVIGVFPDAFYDSWRSKRWHPLGWDTAHSPGTVRRRSPPTSRGARVLFRPALDLIGAAHTGLQGKTPDPFGHLGLRLHPTHGQNAVYRFILRGFDS
jgi:hypothetical protein